MTLVSETVFQATDLARRHREVVRAGRRPGGTTIRDKDGEALLLAPAGPARREQYVLEGLKAAIVVLHVLRQSSPSDPLMYGSLAWLAVLPQEDQNTFVWEYISALQSIDGAGVEGVEQLLYEWQQTARAWSDEGLRVELTEDLSQPLHDVEL